MAHLHLCQIKTRNASCFWNFRIMFSNRMNCTQRNKNVAHLYFERTSRQWLVWKGEELVLADSQTFHLPIYFPSMHRNLLNTGQKGNLNFRKKQHKDSHSSWRKDIFQESIKAVPPFALFEKNGSKRWMPWVHGGLSNTWIMDSRRTIQGLSHISVMARSNTMLWR